MDGSTTSWQRVVRSNRSLMRTSARSRGFTVGCVTAAALVGGILSLTPLGFGLEEYKGQAPAQRCLGLVGVVVVLWSTEAIAPFLTSLLIPLMAIPARVLCVPRHLREISEHDTLLVPAVYCNATQPAPGTPMEPEQAAAVVTGAFFDPVILLFLSGFVMSKVLLKRGISERCAAGLLARAGTNPRVVLGAIMTACACTSAVTSNVPAAVLGTSLVRPTFRPSVTRSSWAETSLLGVAFACNVGGMMSPIASPQNVVALMALDRATEGETTLSFLGWLAVSIPFCMVSTASIFGLLLAAHGSGLPAEVASPWSALLPTIGGTDMEMALIRESERPADEVTHPETEEECSMVGDKEVVSLTGEASGDVDEDTRASQKRVSSPHEDALIVMVIVVTMMLWIFFHHLKPYLGSIGIVALVPIIIFGGCEYISVVDFNNLSWDVLILMGGGLALGTIVDSSGLLLIVADTMGSLLAGESLFVVLLAFSSLVAVLANFISSTVAAVLLLPVVAEVGVSVGHPRMLVLLCVFMTSGAMGLPVSSFPNANSFAQRDVFGAPILSNSHYVKAGFPACALVLVLLNSLGFGLCLALQY